MKILGTVVILYALFGAYVWYAMRQPPETFGRVMARLPQPAVFIVFPFETLWMHARAGTLHIGDSAPDFTLHKLDKSGSVQLSTFAAQNAQSCSIFGSYT